MTDMGRLDLDKTTDAQPERDLVELLRIAAHCAQPDYPAEAALCLEAADELTAYRKRIREIEAEGMSERDVSHNEYVAGLRRDLSLLRSDNKNLREADRQKTHEINILTPENRDLTAKCERLKAKDNPWKALYGVADKDRTRMANLLRDTALERDEWFGKCETLNTALTYEEGRTKKLRTENVRARRWRDYARRVRRQRERFRAKCERLADNLLIRTRELEDRTAELGRSKEEIAYNELRWMEHMTLIRNDLKAQRDGLREAILSASPYQPKYNGRPSCPFCDEFIDEESTHADGCIVTEIREGERGE